MKHNRPAGEPSGYCGVCGVPNEHCDCRQYKEHGVNATNAGTEDANDPFMGKNMGGEKKAEGGEKKAENGEKKAENGDKKPFPGGKPFGKKE